jgi:hypothetical protein
MKLSQQGKASRIVLYILLILFVIALLWFPFGLAKLDIPYQVFILTLFVFFIIYSKTLGGYYFVSGLLSLIDKWEDVYHHISKNVSKDSLYKYLVDWDLLIFSELQLAKVQETDSTLNDITLVFLLGLFVVYLSGLLPDPIFYSVLFAVVIVWVLDMFVALYTSAKFFRVFDEEIKVLDKAFEEWNLENKVEEKAEQVEEVTSEEKNESEKS